MHADWLSIEEDAIDEAAAIGSSFDVAVLIEVNPDVVVGALVGEDSHIWKDVEVVRVVDVDGLVFFDEVTSLGLYDITETTVQDHQHLVLLFVLKRKVVLLVYFVVAFYGLLEGDVVRMRFFYLWRVIPEDEMVLEWSLERLAHQIFESNDPVIVR